MRWFYNLKTMNKLVVGFAAVCAIMAGVGYYGVANMSKINGMLNTLYEREMLGLSQVKEANTTLIKIGRGIRQVAIEVDAEERARVGRNVEGLIQEFRNQFGKAESAFVLPEGKAKYASAKETFDRFEAQLKSLLAVASSRENEGLQNQQVRDGLLKLRSEADAIDNAMTDLSQLKEKLGEQAYNESDVVYAQSRTLMICAILCGLVIGMVIGVVTARIISRPLTQAVDVLNQVAAGDFTKTLDLDTKDEVGKMARALNQAVAGIRGALSDVRSVADSVASAAQQLSAASEEISSGAQEQASNLEETASSLEEITSTVKQNADNAQQANQLANGARDVAEKGGEVVSNAVEGMNEINKASKKIADIITTIDEIAFQTNLLALNAAVEAARAGEQGRGFAVVAGEVRNLAQRSAAAAKEIKGLIQDSVRKVETGSELVNRSGQTLQEIVTSVKRVTDIVAEIAAASREQSSGIDQVSRAVAQMDQVTQANASQTEELSGTAEGLSSQAQELQMLVARFKLGNESNTSSRLAIAETQPAQPRMPAQSRSAAPRKAATTLPTVGQNGALTNGHEKELDLVGVGSNGHHRLNGSFEEF